MKEKVYVWILDMPALMGRCSCEIFYVRHQGNFENLSREALIRGISLTSISARDYMKARRGV